jgi:hypothetical protein
MRFRIFILVLLSAALASGSARQVTGLGAVPVFMADPGEGGQFRAILAHGRARFLRDRVLFRIGDTPLEVRFLGARSDLRPRGEEKRLARVNFIIGNRAKDWATDLATYRTLVYRGVYAGVDARFSFSHGNLKSEFVVAPGSDPGHIRLRYSGLGPARLDGRGGLIFRSSEGMFREEAPIAFQRKGTARIAVTVKFVIGKEGVVGFELGAYDPTAPLTIDPLVLYSTYLGGSGDTAATAIATDTSGNSYICGWSDSLNFPFTPHSFGLTGEVDAFVMKLNAAGNTVLYLTYIGGTGDDRAYGIAVDSAGDAYVTGATTSVDFPNSHAYQISLLGTMNAFVFKLNPAGNSLTFSTYLGGASADNGNAIAVDSQGGAYVTGDTTSVNFPVLGGAQASNGGGQDAFVAKFNSTGGLVYSTYLGGSENENGNAIAVDSAGNAYVTGGTFSTNFPVVNAFQPASGGGQDAFVAKLNSTGSSLVYSTYLGGSGGVLGGPEVGTGIAVNLVGNAFVAGATSSDDFPTTGSSFEPAQSGGTEDGFIVEFSATGSSLVYSTYFGGTTMDYATAIALDLEGNAYIAGYTASADMPTASPVQAALNGTYNAFIAELNAAGDGLIFSTYYGGTSSDSANGIALDSLGDIFVAGEAESVNFPVANAIQSAQPGPLSGFTLKLSPPAPSFGIMVTPNTATVSPGGNATYTVTATAVNGFNGVITFTVAGLPSGAIAVFLPGSVTGSGSSTLTVTTSAGGETGSFSLSITGTSGSSVQSVSVALNVSDFSITVLPASQSVGVGDRTVYLVLTTALNGFGGTISLSASGLPAGATATFTPAAVAGTNTSTLVIGSLASGAVGNYTLTVTGTSGSLVHSSTASLIVTSNGTTSPTPGPGQGFVPVTPCRIADTRNPTGPYGGPPLAAAVARAFAITASACGIPANAQAFALNLTVVPLGPLGFLSVWPTGQPQPGVSTLNSSDGRIKANAAIVPAGTNGSIEIFASNPTNVIVDINGYFVPATPQTLSFYPLTPCRIADTRLGSGAFGSPALAASVARSFPLLSSACNIPSNAQAYSLNLTVVPSGPLGFLSAWPAGLPQPGVSTLNAPTGTIVANAAIIPAGTGGAITVIATNPTDLIIDINGYFAPPGGSGALLYRALVPCRILDTRGADGPFGGPALGQGQERSFEVTLSACLVPNAAQAFSLNATVVPPAALGFLSLWGNNPQPGVSTLNDSDGSIVDNAAIVPAASDGSVSSIASNITQLILDINGYFAP